MSIEKDMPIEILRLINTLGFKSLKRYTGLVSELFHISQNAALDAFFAMQAAGLLIIKDHDTERTLEVEISKAGYDALVGGHTYLSLKISDGIVHAAIDNLDVVMRDARLKSDHLSVMLPLDEFSPEDISDLLSSLNDVYYAISGDNLEIKESGIVHGIYELQNA